MQTWTATINHFDGDGDAWVIVDRPGGAWQFRLLHAREFKAMSIEPQIGMKVIVRAHYKQCAIGSVDLVGLPIPNMARMVADTIAKRSEVLETFIAWSIAAGGVNPADLRLVETSEMTPTGTKLTWTLEKK